MRVDTPYLRITWPSGASYDWHSGCEAIKQCVGPGWGELITSLLEDIKSLGWNGHIGQVKEKFGGLRFYIGVASDEIYERVHQAEEDSYYTCELCGAPGQEVGKHWTYTRCQQCWKKMRESNPLLASWEEETRKDND